MFRYDVINLLLARYFPDGARYLEIGVDKPQSCFYRIHCENKTAVDPNDRFPPPAKIDYQLPSDEFFRQLESGETAFAPDHRWDVIFIDGLHLAHQAYQDILNAVRHCSPQGFVVLHDCNPASHLEAHSDLPYYLAHRGAWNGSTWKALYRFRTESTLKSYTVDTDYGIGVIEMGATQTPIPHSNPWFEFGSFSTHRQEQIGLISLVEFQRRHGPAVTLVADRLPTPPSGQKLSLITCTADRPWAIARAEFQIGRQTLPPDEWIVADDGNEAATLTQGQTHIRRVRDGEGALSLGRNMLSALAAVTGDLIVVIEDDDWYHPEYLATCVRHLQSCQATGDPLQRYYNVAQRRYVVMNNRGSALCQTACQRVLLPLMRQAAEEAIRANHYGIDARFWAKLSPSQYRLQGGQRTVGMKGIPGRSGLGMGHRPDSKRPWRDDPRGTVLRSWIGADADAYLALPHTYQALPRVQKPVARYRYSR